MAKVKKIPVEYPEWVIFEAARLSNPAADRGRTPANVASSIAIRWLGMYGGIGRRVNVQGIYDPKTGKWRPSGMKKGFEDVDGVLPITIGGVKVGLKIAIEVKIGKDTHKPEQIERQREIENAGGAYIIYRTSDQFVHDIHVVIMEKYGVTIR